MTLEESLKLERYKMVTDRQKYVTDVARESFASYTRTFAGFAAGAFALVSLKNQLGLTAGVVTGLLQAIAVLLTLVGVISVAQIVFCLVRWYGFRRAEHEINPACPKAEWWAWLFEGMYCLGIAASVGVAWLGVCYFESILR